MGSTGPAVLWPQRRASRNQARYALLFREKKGKPIWQSSQNGTRMSWERKPRRTGSPWATARVPTPTHNLMPRFARELLLCFLLASALRLTGQDLAPRAYIITPIHANAITLTYGYYNGGLNFGGIIPITGASGSYSVPVVSLYHTFSFFGRSANLTAALPYAVGTFHGTVLGTQSSVYRSGLLDASFRFSVNLLGGPAMPTQDFAHWKQKNLLGVSLKVIAPTGQYNGTKLVNWGINRWAFKPELGYSRRLHNWLLDGYGGAWFYTTNSAAFAGPVTQRKTEEPIGSLEGHLGYDFGQRSWVSFDGNFWWGGITSLSGVANLASKQVGSRLGGTASVRLSHHHSVKVSFSDGTYVRFGGNYKNVSVAWQYSWVGRPN